MFGDLRALVLQMNQTAHGVPATVTPPNQDPIETNVIWVTPVTEFPPASLEIAKAEPVYVMAISRADVPDVPTGTEITAPRKDGGDDEEWIVDGFERIEADKIHVVVREA